MQTLTRPPTAAALLAAQDARAAWRRRVAYAGSLFQLAFAALWLVRGTLIRANGSAVRQTRVR